ncbi:MAG: pantetheine-phosphate adenylyltransferase, partial [Candidatus Marinimicrobia bacterium]|nr:pantetheine-phosphate adenylyltransferase [Candidatus Neomarinimicrobiota bacterium]
MKIAVYPGTFDPVTNGHLDILMRASSIFDVVYVAIVINLRKEPLFSTDERIRLVRECTKDFSNVQIEKFNGLVVDFAQKVGATVVIRGLRAISDFDYEFQMALTNRQLNENVDT